LTTRFIHRISIIRARVGNNPKQAAADPAAGASTFATFFPENVEERGVYRDRLVGRPYHAAVDWPTAAVAIAATVAASASAATVAIWSVRS
jgi:hypothetical protein